MSTPSAKRDRADAFVAASWLRSHAAGVAREGGNIRYTGDVDAASRLVHYARPVLEKLIEYTEDVPLSVAVSDNKGRVLARLDTNPGISPAVDEISLAPGFSYAESEIGTNGVGTVLESGRSVQIVGAEHFHERFQKFSCSGAPIRDPLSGHIEGVLDLTCLIEHSTPLLHSFVRSAASTIEDGLLTDRELSQQLLFDVFSRMDAKARGALLVVGDNVLIANTAAQNGYDGLEQRAIVDHGRHLAETAARAMDEIALSPARTVRIKTTKISSGNTAMGVAILVEEWIVPGVCAELPAAAFVVLGAEHPAFSPPWATVRKDIADAVRSRASILLVGESGVGKATLIRDAVAELRPGGDIVELQPGFDRALATASATRADAFLLLRRVDEISTADAQFLRAALSDAQCGLAATIGDESLHGQTPFRTELLPLFARSTHIPALRHRSIDLPRIATDILSSLTGKRTAALRPAVLRTLTNYPWPGNVAELRAVLSQCLRTRPAGDLKEEDLPSSLYQAPSRTLGELESAERDAIVRSLRKHEGNRVRAAADLGIARSSLYRKIKLYGI